MIFCITQIPSAEKHTKDQNVPKVEACAWVKQCAQYRQNCLWWSQSYLTWKWTKLWIMFLTKHFYWGFSNFEKKRKIHKTVDYWSWKMTTAARKTASSWVSNCWTAQTRVVWKYWASGACTIWLLALMIVNLAMVLRTASAACCCLGLWHRPEDSARYVSATCATKKSFAVARSVPDIALFHG